MAFKLIDPELYADNGDGSYSGVKWCNMTSATLECKYNEADRETYEKIKQVLLGENHYKEKPSVDPLSYEYISDYIYKLLSFHGQYLEEFEIVVDKTVYLDSIRGYRISVIMRNYAYQTQYACSMMIFDCAPGILEMVNEHLIDLVQRYLADIKTKTKINNVKENNTMAQYTYGKFEVIKPQEDIELEEKIAKLRAEYDKKITKLREEFKVAQEKRRNDQRSKEIHDKYQSLIDAGFTEEKAWEILKTQLCEFTF